MSACNRILDVVLQPNSVRDDAKLKWKTAAAGSVVHVADCVLRLLHCQQNVRPEAVLYGVQLQRMTAAAGSDVHMTDCVLWLRPRMLVPSFCRLRGCAMRRNSRG